MNFIKKRTNRGFGKIIFKDRYGKDCSIQDSSLATEPAIWLGIEDAEPKILASEIMEDGRGWVDYIVPENVYFTTRMHLTQDQVKEILPILQKFAETGDYLDIEDDN